MISTARSSDTTGWVAVATGIAGLLALVFIILFFAVGQPFGTLNDAFIALAAILSGTLAWTLYPAHRKDSPQLSAFALLAAVAGAVVVVVGSYLVISGTTGFFLAGLYMTVGYALVGLWLAALSYTALRGTRWPRSLVVLGLGVGLIMLLGLASVPGIAQGIDDAGVAPWYVNTGYVGTLGWLLLYPLWCVWLGRFLLPK